MDRYSCACTRLTNVCKKIYCGAAVDTVQAPSPSSRRSTSRVVSPKPVSLPLQTSAFDFRDVPGCAR